MKNLPANNYLFNLSLFLISLIIVVGIIYLGFFKNIKPPLMRTESGINVVTINDATYDAVICPMGSTDSLCTHFGAREMQQVINNAPQRPKDNPYKVFIKNGEYKGFESVIYDDLSIGDFEGFNYTRRAIFLIRNNMEIQGESLKVVLDGGDMYSDFFSFVGDYRSKLSTLYLKNLSKDIVKDIENSCPEICNKSTGNAVVTTNTVYLTIESLNFRNFYSSTIYARGTSTLQVFNIRSYFAGGIYSLYNGRVEVYNSVFYNATVNLSYNYMDSTVEIYNSVLYKNGTSSRNFSCVYTDSTKKMLVVNSIIAECDAYGINTGDKGIARVGYSFIYNWDATYGAFDGDVQVTADPKGYGTFTNPIMILNQSNIEDPLNFTFASNNSKVRNAGDPAILDPDGSRSDIGLYGGPYACLVKNDLPGCSNTQPTPSTPTPTQTLIPSISQLPVYNYADLNKDGVSTLADVLELLKIIFK